MSEKKYTLETTLSDINVYLEAKNEEAIKILFKSIQDSDVATLKPYWNCLIKTDICINP